MTDVLEIKSLLSIEMGGYLLIFSQDLHDWLKAQNIPGVTIDYNTIAGGICQVQVSPEQSRNLWQEWRESRKQDRELVANGQSAT